MSSLASQPARLLRGLAFTEMVTWILLILAMIGKYALRLEVGGAAVRIAGGLHGFVFLAYCLGAVLIAVDQRWRLADLVAALASAVVPFLTVPFERSAQRRGLLGSTWRLLAAPAATRPERLVSAAVRRPLPSAAIGVLGVAATFGLLLAAGPPTQWFS